MTLPYATLITVDDEGNINSKKLNYKDMHMTTPEITLRERLIEDHHITVKRFKNALENILIISTNRKPQDDHTRAVARIARYELTGVFDVETDV